MTVSAVRNFRLESRQQELLRWLALLSMLIDHVGALFVPAELATPFRAIGRIAWPLFALLLAYNVAVRGVDPTRYLGKLALFTAVSQLPHTLAFGWQGVSIMGTLLLGALSLAVLERRLKQPVVVLATIALVVVGSGFVEYGIQGILLIVALWWALSVWTPVSWLLAAVAVAAVNLPSALWPYGLLAIPVSLLVARLPAGAGLPRSGLLPWIFYPAHLLVLVLVRSLSGSG